ncbi:MAG: D-aminoacyl-tRNA deacylase [archaeon]|jgi:D-aminoacyl-tRNA deacylase
MNFLLVFSEKDPASINFYNTFTNNYEIKDNQLVIDGNNSIFLCKIDEMHIFILEKNLYSIVSNYKEIDYIIFLSKHSTLSETKPHSITVHAIGNWGKAELGGVDETVVETDPILIRSLLLELYDNKPKSIAYEIKQEATHHGPFLKKPTIFVEIGSEENAWNDPVVSRFVVDCLIKVIKNYDKEKIKNENGWIETVGIGGSHYCTKFNRFTFNKEEKYCFGHIIPDYALKEIFDKQKLKLILEQAKQKSNSQIILTEKLEEAIF